MYDNEKDNDSYEHRMVLVDGKPSHSALPGLLPSIETPTI